MMAYKVTISSKPDCTMDEILIAKVILYRLLLNAAPEGVSENEANLIYYLAKDEGVQLYLEKQLDTLHL